MFLILSSSLHFSNYFSFNCQVKLSSLKWMDLFTLKFWHSVVHLVFVLILITIARWKITLPSQLFLGFLALEYKLWNLLD